MSVLRLGGGVEVEVLHTPGHTPGELLLPRPGRRLRLLRRPGVRGHDRAIGLRELRSGGDAAEPRTVPHAARRAGRPSGARPSDDGRARARVEPVPRRDRLSVELAPPTGDPGPAARPVRRDARSCTSARRQAAELFGFRYVETPTFEHTELFARTSGDTSDVVTKEMYTFEDKGGRRLTLRPEGTAPRRPRLPVARATISARRSRRLLRRSGVPARAPAGRPAARVPPVRRRDHRRRGAAAPTSR